MVILSHHFSIGQQFYNILLCLSVVSTWILHETILICQHNLLVQVHLSCTSIQTHLALSWQRTLFSDSVQDVTIIQVRVQPSIVISAPGSSLVYVPVVVYSDYHQRTELFLVNYLSSSLFWCLHLINMSVYPSQHLQILSLL